jgi:hypothetical protein
MQKVVTEYSVAPWNLFWKFYSSGKELSYNGMFGAGWYDRPWPDLSLDRPHYESVAIKRARSGASGSAFDGLTSALEARETIGTLQSVGIRARKYLRKGGYKRFVSDLKKVRYWDDALLEQYLELRYAFRPMYYEARQAVEAFDSSLSDRYTSRGFTRTSVSASSPYESVWAGDAGSPGQLWTATLNSKIEFSVRAGVLSQIDPSFSKGIIWGINDPFQSFWQATKLSFMIDWVLNVGDTIGSISPKVGVSELASWIVSAEVRTDEVTNWVISPYNPQPGTVVVGGGGVARRTTTTITRTPSPTFSLIPEFNLRVNLLKLVDAYAILRQVWLKDCARIRRFERNRKHATR